MNLLDLLLSRHPRMLAWWLAIGALIWVTWAGR